VVHGTVGVRDTLFRGRGGVLKNFNNTSNWEVKIKVNYKSFLKKKNYITY